MNIPSKFIDRADGRTMWLCYSANFSCISLNQVYRSVPTGSSYKMCLQEFRLVGRDEEAGASSVHKGYMSNAATDGAVAGWPGDAAAEWASDMERESAFIRLDWDKVQVLFFLVYFLSLICSSRNPRP